MTDLLNKLHARLAAPLFAHYIRGKVTAVFV